MLDRALLFFYTTNEGILCKVGTYLLHGFRLETKGGCIVNLPACPVETTLLMIGDKWKTLILRDLMNGTKRFGELKKSIGTVSQKVLTAQLRDMEAKGLLTRKIYAEVPPRVEYTLTDIGYSLRPVLEAMCAWGEGYQARMKQCGEQEE